MAVFVSRNESSDRLLARQLYRDAVVIDGLNVSNWDSPAVFRSLRDGNVTAINATIATWENFHQPLDHISRWETRFSEYDADLLQVRTVDDIERAQRDGVVGASWVSRTLRLSKTTWTGLPCFASSA